jgi:hypothetical protein
MLFLFYSLVFIFLVFILSIFLEIVAKLKECDLSSRLILGSSLTMVFGGAFAHANIIARKILILALIIIVLFTLLKIITTKFLNNKNFMPILISFFIQAFSFIAFSRNFSPETLKHMSPDPYGYNSLTGYFLTGKNMKTLESTFIELVQTIDVESNLRIPWSISDSATRFSADLGFNFGRVASSGYLSALDPLVNSVNNWWVAWFSFGFINNLIFGLILASFTVKVGKHLGLNLHNYIFVILSIYFSFIPINLIFLTEGASIQVLPHIFFVYLTIHFLYLIFDINFNVNLFILNNLFIGVALILSYPHSFVISWVISTLISFFIILKKSHSSRKNIVFFALANIIPVAFFFSDLSFANRILWGFFSGVGGGKGGALQSLGKLSINDLIGLTRQNIKLSDVQIGGYIFTGTSYSSFLLSFIVVFIFIHLGFILNFYSEIYFWKKLFLIFIITQIFFIPFYQIALRIILNNEINQYVYFRQISLSTILILPILIYFSLQLFKKLNFLVFKVFSLSILIWFSFVSFFNLYIPYDSNSIKPYWFEKCLQDLENKILFTDTPNEAIFALATCGPVYYATDNWQPKFLVNDKIWKAVHLKPDGQEIEIAKLKITEEFITPCDMNCLREYLKKTAQ